MSDAPRIVFYTDAPAFGGAEASLGILLSELDPRFEVAIAAVERSVAERLATRRPEASVRVLPAVRTKQNVDAFAATTRAIRA